MKSLPPSRLQNPVRVAIGMGLISVGLLGEPAVAGQANQADSFVDSIGVGVHMWSGTYPANYQVLKTKLIAANIRHVRDDLAVDRPFGVTAWKDLAANGIKTGYIFALQWATIDTFKNFLINNDLLKTVDHFEGPNEFEGTRTDWVTAFKDYQTELYTKMKADPRTAGFPILAPSFKISASAARTEFGNISSIAEFGNCHPYPGGQMPSTNQTTSDIASCSITTGSKPVVVTEIGYQNALKTTSGHNPASEAATALYLPRLYFNTYSWGIKRTYWYQFFDHRTDGGTMTDVESYFGLIRYDTSEKPAYVALKNLTTIMKDPGPSFAPGSLNYSTSGGANTSILFQKRDGTFYLALWREVSVWNISTRTDITPSAVNVTVSLPGSYKVEAYSPTTSASPLQTWTGVSSATVSLRGETRILRISSKPTVFSQGVPPPTATRGWGYSGYTFAANGAPWATYSIAAGTLPPGLSLSSTGVLSGTPTTEGVYSGIVARASNEVGTLDSAPFSITVNPEITVSPASLPDWTVGVAYDRTITAGNGTGAKVFAVTAGTLPNGLSLNGNNGALSGTPTSAGTFNFTIAATDTVGATTSRAYAVTINAPMSFGSGSLSNGLFGEAFNQAIALNNGTGTRTFSITGGALPSGLTLNPSSGVINGAPTATGIFNFTLTGVDSVGSSVSQAYTFAINRPPAFTNAPVSALVQIHGAYAFSYMAIGFPAAGFSVTAGALPPGVNLSAAGHLSGAPTEGGVFSGTVTAANGVAPVATQGFSIVVNRPPLPASNFFETSKEQPLALTVSALVSNDTDPDGDTLAITSLPTVSAKGGALSLNATEDEITYTPAAGFDGMDTFTYAVSDGRGGAADGLVTIEVTAESETVLRVLSISRTPQNTIKVRFAGVPGDTYRVQGTDDLRQPFGDLSGGVKTADGAGFFEYEDTAYRWAGNRFYRAVRQ